MNEVHEAIAKAIAEDPQLAASFDWSKLIQAIEVAIPMIMQIIAIFTAPVPVPIPTPKPTPTPSV